MFCSFLDDHIMETGVEAWIYAVINSFLIGVLKSIASVFWGEAILSIPFIIASVVLTVIAFKNFFFETSDGCGAYLEYGNRDYRTVLAFIYFVLSVVLIYA